MSILQDKFELELAQMQDSLAQDMEHQSLTLEKIIE